MDAAAVAEARVRSTVVEIGGHRVLRVGDEELSKLMCAVRDDAVEQPVGEIRWSMPAQWIANRLDVLGVGPARAEAAFSAEIARRENDIDRQVPDIDLVFPDPVWEESQKRWDEVRAYDREDLRLLALDLPTWLARVRKAANQEPSRTLLIGVEPDRIEWLVGLVRDLDCLVALRLLLLAFPRQEVTVRVPNDLLRHPLSHAPTAVYDSLRAFELVGSIYSPTVVLTEGSTDAAILGAALKVLYPHLVDLIRFMDFHPTNKPEGSASALVRMVKAFNSAGITNRIVALFDYDTAAEEALRALGKSKVRDTIAIRHYPPLAWAKDYPTVHPPGSKHSAGCETRVADVNGVACSIEMYVGRENRMDGGTLLPVELTAFIPGVGRHQGVLAKKTSIQRNFLRRAEAALVRGGPEPEEDWTDLDRIIRMIIEAHCSGEVGR